MAEYENTFVKEVKEHNMTDPLDILNWYRNLYYKEGNHLEHGIVAYAINDLFVKYKDKLFADVVPKSEVEGLEYKLTGVMHSVDKWLEGDELNQDEVNRAMTMREKTLKIVEALEDERDRYKKYYFRHEYDKWEAEIKQEVAKQIFEEVEEMSELSEYREVVTWESITELKKKYIGEYR